MIPRRTPAVTRASQARRPSALEPDVLAEFLKQATAAHSAGRFDEAIALYEHVERHNPDASGATYFRALIDIERGALEPALKRLRSLVLREPHSFEPLFALAYTYRELGRWEQAADTYRRAIAAKPDAILARFNLGDVLEVLGRMDDAVALYRELAADPATRLRALGRIAMLKPAAITPDEQAEIEQTLADPSLGVGPRLSLHFALGGLLERQGLYNRAFAAYAEGNRLKRETLEKAATTPPPALIAPPDARIRTEAPDQAAHLHTEQVAFAKRVFTPDFIARYSGRGHDSNAPIFIVGMPRSGTTLLEQILSSHPKVTGLGEGVSLWDAMGGGFPYRPGATEDAIDSRHFRRLGEAYLDRLRARGWKGSGRVIDKMLGNYMLIGIIHLMFPRAIILHSMRDPVDTCFSCFRQTFRTGNETTYDLRDVGAQYVRYRAVMAHWHEVLPGRVVDVRHEDLIEEPERMIRWLVTEACGLKWDDGCLRFFESSRPVRTASLSQVRQPIFRGSVERWRHYESHLGPLFDALGPYAPAREPSVGSE